MRVCLRSRFLAQKCKDVFQAFKNVVFGLRKLLRVKFKGDGALVLGVTQMIKESGERQDSMPRQQMLATVTVVGEMDIENTVGIVAEKKIIDEIRFSGPHVGAVKCHVQVVIPDEIDHSLHV